MKIISNSRVTRSHATIVSIQDAQFRFRPQYISDQTDSQVDPSAAADRRIRRRKFVRRKFVRRKAVEKITARRISRRILLAVNPP